MDSVSEDIVTAVKNIEAGWAKHHAPFVLNFSWRGDKIYVPYQTAFFWLVC